MRGARLPFALVGALLCAAFLRSPEVHGFGALFARMTGGFGPTAFNTVGHGESWLWLVTFLLWLPGVACLTEALGPGPRAALGRGWTTLARRLHDGRWGWVGLAVVAFVAAQIGRYRYALDLPLTDDELSVRYGAQVWLSGNLLLPELQPTGAFDLQYLYTRDGLATSFDFPGVIAAQALAMATGLDGALYSWMAAATALCVVLAVRQAGRADATAAAALLWLCSPMAAMLSWTTHAHVASRMWVAVALMCAARLWFRGGSSRWGVALGCAAGAGFLTRPGEVSLILAPVGLALMLRAGEREDLRAAVAVAAGCAVAGIVAHAAYNLAVTGGSLLPPRWLAPPSEHIPERSVWVRSGSNLGFNLLMLSVWALGPVGVVIATWGASCQRFAGWVGTGVLVVLAMALTHDNTGIHSVGPIHYSETIVPLTVMAALGISAAAQRVHRDRVTAHALAQSLGVLGVLTVASAPSIRDQAEYQRAPMLALESAGVQRAVVLAKRPIYWGRIAKTGGGSWVLAFPRPNPAEDENLVFAKWDADVTALRKRFPDHAIVRLHYRESEPVFAVEAVE